MGGNMFDNLKKQLEALNGTQIKIDIPIDDNGYIDRLCQNNQCHKIFKVNFEDWKNIVQDEIVYCPICRATASSGEWNTAEQQEYINKQALVHIKDEFESAIRKDVSVFNRKQKPGFISMKLSYKPGSKDIPIPPSVADALTQHYTCEKCNCRYAYLGTAFFCPACGNENVEENIKETINNIEKLIVKYEDFKKAFTSVRSTQETESYLTQIIEEHFCKVVSLIQKYTEFIFNNYPNSASIKKRKNLFQNLRESSEKWKELTGIGYEDILDISILEKVNEYFQIRHLLSHTGGIVDSDFLQKVPSSSYTKGQRISIDIENLRDFVNRSKIFLDTVRKEYKKP